MFNDQNVFAENGMIYIELRDNLDEYNLIWNEIPPNYRFYQSGRMDGNKHFCLDPSYMLNMLVANIRERKELQSKIAKARMVLDFPFFTDEDEV